MRSTLWVAAIATAVATAYALHESYVLAKGSDVMAVPASYFEPGAATAEAKSARD